MAGPKSPLHEPEEWPLEDWALLSLTSAMVAFLTFGSGYDDTFSSGHKITIGNSILQIALIWHFLHYPETYTVPAQFVAYGLYDATLALYTTVPPWTVTTALGLAGVVPLASGLWPVLRGGE